jgi:serine/threonine protein kinase
MTHPSHPPRAPMAELIFDKYEIQHRLAVGGMGEVFYAVQRGVKGFERPVILKSLLPDLAQQDGFIDQFLDEARVAATLNHPNLVSIYEVGLWNGVYFIAMEYIRGRNLSQLMKKAIGEHKLPVPQVMVRIVRDAALGLEHAHRALDGQGQALNIVHRDISPQNIMVRDDGVTKVVDFGIARASNRSTRTATGAVKGKLAYMAPEQILGRPITPLADQFALGLVLWEMLAAKRLFQAEQDVDLIRKVLDAKIPAPSTFNPKVDPALDALVLQMANRDPSSRFASCARAAEALEDWLGQHTAGSVTPAAFMQVLGTEDLTVFPKVTPHSNQNFVITLKDNPGSGTSPRHNSEAVTPTSARMIRSKPKRRAPLLLGSALALVLVALVGWFLLQEPPDAPVVEPEPVGATHDTKEEKVPPQLPLPPPAPSMITFNSEPPGAALRLDGRVLGRTPQRVEVGPGSHPLQLEKDGYRRLEEEFTARPGEERAVTFKLEVLPRTVGLPKLPVAAQTGRAYAGETPLVKEFPAGPHVVLLVNAERGISQTRQVTIEPGKTSKLDLNFK